MTTIRSASSSASSRYWVVSSRVTPPATSSRITFHIRSLLAGSSPVVGSSRKSTGGLVTRPAARSRRRRIPPEYSFSIRSAASVRSNWPRSSAARFFALDGGRFLHDVVAGDPGPALVGQGQGGQDAEGGGLARAVRPEDAEDGSGRDLQVDPWTC